MPSAISCSNELRGVDDLVVAAELRVLVLERVEAVRAVGDDLLDVVAVEHLDAHLRHRLEQVLVADAARRVAVAGLLGAEDREVDPGLLEDLGEGLRGLLVAIVERRRRSRRSRGTRRRGLSAMIGTSSPSAQSPRVPASMPHGLPWVSMPLNVRVSSAGKRASSWTRWRRMSTILSTYSMSTGQASSQARQVVHAQSTSSWMTLSSPTMFSPTVDRLRLRHRRRCAWRGSIAMTSSSCS